MRPLTLAARIAVLLGLVVAAVAVTPGPASAGLGRPYNSFLKSFTGTQWCLDLDSGTEFAPGGTNVQLYNCRAWGSQFFEYQVWFAERIPNRPTSEFKIVNRQNTDRCLTYRQNGTPGTPVWAAPCNQAGQGWWLGVSDPNDPTDYFVAVETAGFCLSAVNFNGGHRSGVNLNNCQPRLSLNRWVVS